MGIGLQPTKNFNAVIPALKFFGMELYIENIVL